jgi:hypothetical protein
MRLPLCRFNGDQTPVAWWEWIFAPIVMLFLIPLLLLGAILSIPYYTLYPERHAHEYDLGTGRQRELMRRYRSRAARVTLPQRIGWAFLSPYRLWRKKNNS